MKCPGFELRTPQKKKVEKGRFPGSKKIYKGIYVSFNLFWVFWFFFSTTNKHIILIHVKIVQRVICPKIEKVQGILDLKSTI